MRLPRYEVKAEDDLTVFEFVSEGPRGRIAKLILFGETNLKDTYNLVFGDKDPVTGTLNDTAISDNGDSDKVLATVVAAVRAFCHKYPDVWVYATGSTPSRTRLYRMGLSRHHREIVTNFNLYGQRNDEWEEFMPAVDYDAFIARRKPAITAS